MTQSGIAGMLAVEFSIIGAVAAVIGAGGGSLLSWTVVTRGLELEWRPQPLILLVGVLVTLALTVATGILSSRKALQQPPAAVLRGD